MTTATETTAATFRHLDHLFQLMREGRPSTLREDGTFRGDLPVFGEQHQDEGGRIDPAPGVWTWDWSRAIHGDTPATVVMTAYTLDAEGRMKLTGYAPRGQARRSESFAACHHPECAGRGSCSRSIACNH